MLIIWINIIQWYLCLYLDGNDMMNFQNEMRDYGDMSKGGHQQY